MANQTLYAVGVGDFIAFKGGQFYASGKFDTETNMEFTASYLDIRAGKRAQLVARYAHSSNATFSIIAANYAPEIMKASMGGQDVASRGITKEESLTIVGGKITLSETPKKNGDISASVWIKYQGNLLGALTANASNEVTIPTTPATSPFAKLNNGDTVCAIYVYGNNAASSITMPAEVNPDILHIFVDIDLCTDKAGSGIVGRQVIEIPLAQLNPEQTINATMDGYSQSKLTGVMLADKSASNNACGGKGVYAYITTEVFDANWWDDIYAITNDIDDITISAGSSVQLNLLGLQYGGRYKYLGVGFYDEKTNSSTESGLLHVTVTGTNFSLSYSDEGLPIVETTSGATGTGTVAVTLPVTVGGVTTYPLPTYTLEIQIQA